LENIEETVCKLDKGTGQLSNKLNEVKEHLSNNKYWSKEIYKVSKGKDLLLTKKEYIENAI
jgi:hypothetical protein